MNKNKPTEYMNCGVYKKRRNCWKTNRYGDAKENGKIPFPRNAVCASFTYDKRETE